MQATRTLLSLLALTISYSAIAAGPPSPPAPVTGQTTTIVNGPNNPVPVGTVDATGAVVPVSPSSPMPVNIKSPTPLPVTVTGTSTNPIAVTNAPLEPMQFSADLDVPDGSNEFFSSILHVPAGKRFVMEFISLFVSLPAGQGGVFGVFLNDDDAQGFTEHKYILLGTKQDFGSQGIVYIVSQQVRLYVDHAFDLEGVRTILSGTGGQGHFAVSGYLVDIP